MGLLGAIWRWCVSFGLRVREHFREANELARQQERHAAEVESLRAKIRIQQDTISDLVARSQHDRAYLEWHTKTFIRLGQEAEHGDSPPAWPRSPTVRG